MYEDVLCVPKASSTTLCSASFLKILYILYKIMFVEDHLSVCLEKGGLGNMCCLYW